MFGGIVTPPDVIDRVGAVTVAESITEPIVPEGENVRIARSTAAT